MNFLTRIQNNPSDPPSIAPAQGMCAWRDANTDVSPNPLTYEQGFQWTATFICTQLCNDPHHKYTWNIYAWDDEAAGGAGDWFCIFDWNFTTGGLLGSHGGIMDLPSDEAQDWWDDNANPENFDLSKGLKFNCKVKCVVCGNSMETGAIIGVENYPDVP